MKRFKWRALASAAVTLGLTHAAFAQSTPLYNWGGFAIGGNAGYGGGTSTFSGENNYPVSESFRPHAFIGGLQAGLNFQASQNWVLGFEVDYQWTNQKASNTSSPPVCDSEGRCSVVATRTVTIESRLSSLSTQRGRIGYTADSMPNLLWYGTAGTALGRVKTAGHQCYSDSEGKTCDEFLNEKTKLGWTAGAGVEGILAGNWRWKIEYLYVDLGSAAVPVPGPRRNEIDFPTAHITENVGRIGLSYLFPATR